MQESLTGKSAESITDQAHDLAETRGLPRLRTRQIWQSFGEDLPIAGVVPAPKASRLQMNLNALALPRQVAFAAYSGCDKALGIRNRLDSGA